MRRSLVLLSTMAFVAALLAMPGLAYADSAMDNAACLSCHGAGAAPGLPQVDFAVGPVDRSSACNKCHWISPHPKHFRTAQCGVCHTQWFLPYRTTFFQSVTPTMYGYFTTTSSAEADAARLHEIHTKRTWVAEVKEYAPSCASCHAAAACEACHESALPHGAHGVSGDPSTGSPTTPVRTVTAAGVPSGTVDLIDRTVSADDACAAAACHAAPEGHSVTDDLDPSVAYSDDWTTDEASSLLGGSITYSFATGASFETTFAGTGFAWLGARESNGGIADVYVDGAKVASVDTYRTAWGYDRTVYWTEGLAQGTHTLRVVNTGAKNASSSGTKVSVQALDFRQAASFVPTPACTNCHDTLEEHYGPERHATTYPDFVSCIGSGCHTSGDLSSEHQVAVPGSDCTLCHGNTTDPRYAHAIAAGDTSCAACHDVAEGATHRVIHWAEPLLSDAAGPHYGYYTGSASTAPTTDCTMCHTSNLVDEHMGVTEGPYVTRPPRYDSAGDALTCASCHSSEDFAVLDAIATGVTTCEACHPVHGPIASVHVSSFTPDADTSCTQCHSSDLTVVHDGTYSVTTPSGKTLTGCDVCHGYYEGERGAQVQFAISVANDTRCTACHAEYHTGAMASHTADDSASIDGCGQCHGTAGQPMDVTAVHAQASVGTCAVCHSNPARVPDITAKTAECASCHTTQGSDYHRALPGAHTYEAMPAGCLGANCHAASTLPEAHEPYLARYPQYPTTCALCHANADPGRIDWESASADCSSCHTVHGDVSTIHTASAPERCFTCHKTADAFAIHKDRVEGECDVCHANPSKGDLTVGKQSTDCDGCHAEEGTDFHTGMTAKHQGLSGTSGCDVPECHGSIYVPQIHERFVGAGTQYPQYTDSCALCHMNDDPGRIDWTVAVNGTCSNCHAYPQHQTAYHRATSAESSECVACHGSDWVPVIHDPTQQWKECNLCHYNPTKGDLTWDKTDSDCEQCHDKYPAATKHYPATSHTATETAACAGCHRLELAPEHIKPSSGEVDCLGCHTSTLFSGMRRPWDRTCSACHAARHEEMSVKHASSATGCGGGGCHDLTDVSAIHAGLIGGGCSACHTSDTAVPTSTTCTDCHEGHGDLTAAHTAPESQACVDCHESADVRAVHGTSAEASCAYCHTEGKSLPASTACVNCHDEYAQIDPAHYPAASHDASAESGCNQCHYKDMKAEHFKPTVAVTCVTCHEVKVDTFTAPWDKTCAACHPTKHTERQAKHVSPTTTCGGAGCHDTNNVDTVHTGIPGGGCGVCHVSPSQPATTTACTDAGCHADIGADHHEAHNAASANPAGCKGCHFMYVDDEHAALGLSCATCHDSTNTTVQSAIAGGDLTCLTCHPDSAHNARQAYEFSPKSSSLHRVSPDLPGMRSSFSVNGATYTWPLPTASTFLKSGWATDSVMTCDACHTYTGSTGPHGSAMTVNIDPAYATSWKTAYLSGSANGMNSTTVICAKCHDLNGASSSSAWSNQVHGESDHHGSSDGKCVLCHSQLPHGWKRPRMLAYTSDGAPYASTGLRAIRLANHTASGWSEHDCQTSCGEHDSSVSPVWPLVLDPDAPTTGGVAGKVTDSATGAAVSGATVSVAGKTATTASDGAYAISGIAGGTYTMTVSKTGYTTWSQPVTITNGVTLTQNVALVAGTGGTNLALGKSFTASHYESSAYAPGKAGDGSDSTFWWSNNTGGASTTEWLRVDLGTTYKIKETDIAWYGDYWAKEFRVYTSLNGSTWNQVYSTTTAPKGTSVVTFTARDARYVKVECRRTGTGRSTGYGIAELKVFQ